MIFLACYESVVALLSVPKSDIEKWEAEDVTLFTAEYSFISVTTDKMVLVDESDKPDRQHSDRLAEVSTGGSKLGSVQRVSKVGQY